MLHLHLGGLEAKKALLVLFSLFLFLLLPVEKAEPDQVERVREQSRLNLLIEWT